MFAIGQNNFSKPSKTTSQLQMTLLVCEGLTEPEGSWISTRTSEACPTWVKHIETPRGNETWQRKTLPMN